MSGGLAGGSERERVRANNCGGLGVVFWGVRWIWGVVEGRVDENR